MNLSGAARGGIGMTSPRTRQRMVDRLRTQGIADERVLTAMSEIPRHLFVDEALASRAYEDTALPIGFNQTISQPYVVARMTELLIADRVPTRVLEVGTGSGYQAAVLTRLVGEVYTVERIHGLLRQARKRLFGMHLENVHTRHADGGIGWPERAPFDAILVTAGAERVSQGLLDQLAPNARLVAPVGSGEHQYLRLIVRQGGVDSVQDLDIVCFVPLLGGTT
jgi:protein-L-isoaspartate(D-aspartate) O-methyltransferase